MSLCPDKPILAGFSRSFAPYPFSTLEGCYDGDVICLTRRTVNTSTGFLVPIPKMQKWTPLKSQKREGCETILSLPQHGWRSEGSAAISVRISVWVAASPRSCHTGL